MDILYRELIAAALFLRENIRMEALQEKDVPVPEMRGGGRNGFLQGIQRRCSKG
jgi:hypothetical protein